MILITSLKSVREKAYLNFLLLKMNEKKQRFLPSAGFVFMLPWSFWYYIRVIGDSLQLPKRLKLAMGECESNLMAFLALV